MEVTITVTTYSQSVAETTLGKLSSGFSFLTVMLLCEARVMKVRHDTCTCQISLVNHQIPEVSHVYPISLYHTRIIQFLKGEYKKTQISRLQQMPTITSLQFNFIQMDFSLPILSKQKIHNNR